MHVKNPDTNELEEVYLPPAGDTLPIGSEVEYDGDTIPTGWELVEDLGTTNTKKIKKVSQAVGLVGSVTTDISDANDNAVPNAKTVKNYVDTNNKFVPLWTGSELPAGKTYSLADNIYNYRFIVVVAEWGNKITIPIIEGNTYLFGGCNYVAGSSTAIVTCGLSANITDSGNKVSVTNLKTILHNQNSSHDTLENPKLLGIYGAI